MKLVHLLVFACTLCVLSFDDSSAFADDTVALAEQNAAVTASQTAAVSPYSFRIAIEGGDQLGGPVRYDTRFPTAGKDPNPSSYYHTQAFAGANFEIPFSKGALVVSGLMRKDLAHRSMEGRSDFGSDGALWTVKKMEFRSYALSCGWIFGKMYREAAWKASLASVVDVARVSTQIEDLSDSNRVYESDSNLIAMTLRGRVLWRLFGTGMVDFHMGPELHLPVYSRKSTKSSTEDASWVGDTVDLRSSAAIGLVAEVGTRF